MKKKFETLTKKSQNVYIIPSKDGLRFLFINFFLFLIAITYTNNMALLVTFIMVTFFILQMFSTHRIINLLQLSDFEIPNQFLNIHHPGLAKFKVEVPTEYSEYLTASLVPISAGVDEVAAINTIAEENASKINFEFNFNKRGLYQFNKLKLYTFGPSKLFYVWRYFPIDINLYIYPKKNYVERNKKSQNESKVNSFSEQEFSEHIRYRPGMPAKRIDWKVFARTDDLYWKYHNAKQSRIYEVNYNSFQGNKEEILEKMSYLVDHYFHQGDEYKLILPSITIPTSSGTSHYNRSMEAISVF